MGQTPAERKREQRARAAAALREGDLALASTSGLAESVTALVTAGDAVALAAVLRELGRRGGLTVTTRRSK